jgi:hypothetical protein
MSLAACVREGTAWSADSVLIYNQGAVDEANAQGVGEWVGLRTPHHTYVRHLDGRPWLLYDNAVDPFQLRNCIGDPDLAAVQAQLDAELDRQICRTGLPTTPWAETLVRLGLRDLWNERELNMHPRDPRLLP